MTEMPDSAEAAGCRRLLGAILQHAIIDLFSNTVDHYREAETWMYAKNKRPFSFFWVCEHLELDPIATRRACLMMREQHPSFKPDRTVVFKALGLGGDAGCVYRLNYMQGYQEFG